MWSVLFMFLIFTLFVGGCNVLMKHAVDSFVLSPLSFLVFFSFFLCFFLFFFFSFFWGGGGGGVVLFLCLYVFLFLRWVFMFLFLLFGGRVLSCFLPTALLFFFSVFFSFFFSLFSDMISFLQVDHSPGVFFPSAFFFPFVFFPQPSLFSVDSKLQSSKH